MLAFEQGLAYTRPRQSSYAEISYLGRLIQFGASFLDYISGTTLARVQEDPEGGFDVYENLL